MAFTHDGIAPPGIPLLSCSHPHHDEVQNGLWGVTTIQLMANSRTPAEFKNWKLENPSLLLGL